MNYKIQNATAAIFSACVAVLTVFCIFSIWELVSSDVLTKSLETIGLVGVAALIVMVAARVIDSRKDPSGAELHNTEGGVSAFRSVRKVTVAILIISVTIAALVGVLAIWDVLTHSALHKSLASMAILAFSAVIITIVCLEREGNDMLTKRIGSGGTGTAGSFIKFVVFVIILVWLGSFVLNFGRGW